MNLSVNEEVFQKFAALNGAEASLPPSDWVDQLNLSPRHVTIRTGRKSPLRQLALTP